MISSRIVKLDTELAQAREPPRIQAESGELAELKIRCSKLQQENRQNLLLAERVQQYQRILDRSDLEMIRLNTVISEKASQVDHWRDKTGRFEAHLQEIKNMKENSYASISQSRVRHVEEERQRVQEQLKFKSHQIDDWKNKCISLERIISNYKVVESEKRGIEDQLNYQIRISDEYQRKLSTLQDAASRIHELENDLQNQESHRMEFIEELQSLNGVIQIKTSECDHFTSKIYHLQDQIRSLRGVERQIFQEKRRSQLIQEELMRIKQLIADKCVLISQIKQEFGNRKYGEKDGMQKTLEGHANEIGELYEKIDKSNRQNDEYQLQLMGANSQISNLNRQIEIILLEKQSAIAMYDQKAQQCENSKKQCMARLDEIRQLRKSESACFQYQAKLKNIQVNYRNVEQRYKKQTYKNEELNRAVNRLKSDMQKIRREGYYPQSFLQEFAIMTKDYIVKEREMRQLEGRLTMMEKMFSIFKRELSKYNEQVKKNQKKWELVTGNVDQVSDFVKKSMDMHNQIGKISQENIDLESSKRLMTFQLTQSNMLSKSFILDPNSTEQSYSPSFTRNTSRTRFAGKPPSYVKYEGLRKSAIQPIRPSQSQYLLQGKHETSQLQLINPISKKVNQ